jgi:hypothetical protein
MVASVAPVDIAAFAAANGACAIVHLVAIVVASPHL